MPSSAARHPAVTAADVLDVAASISAAEGVDELRQLLETFFLRFGYLGFTFAAVRRVKSLYLHARMLHTWPATIQTNFEQAELFNADPIIIRSRTALEPFVWDLSVYDCSDPIQQELARLRKGTGVSGGLCVPLAEAFEGRSVLFLSGKGFDASAQSVLCITLVAQHMMAKLNLLNRSSASGGSPGGVFQSDGELSARERQVLGWIAFGKSSREVAQIMAISEHTVNDYIASAMAKLNASNRTEAVLRALLTNQIDLS